MCKPEATARFHQAKGEIKPQSSRVQNQLWMAGVHSALGKGGGSRCHSHTEETGGISSKPEETFSMETWLMEGDQEIADIYYLFLHRIWFRLTCHPGRTWMDERDADLSSFVLLSSAFENFVLNMG